MKLFLHSPTDENKLTELYRRAFKEGVEIFLVSAFLTHWEKSLELNKTCKVFRFSVGQDFGITRKDACHKVLKWLRPDLRANFLIANTAECFHPKALFWKTARGECYAVIGSSNLTHAAFNTNIEANGYGAISSAQFKVAQDWIAKIEAASEILNAAWLKKYEEAIRGGHPARNTKRKLPKSTLTRNLVLPRPAGIGEHVRKRRRQLRDHASVREKLMRLFKLCANGRLSSARFYKQLPNYWNYETGKLQGKGWERTGEGSNFRSLAKSFVKIAGSAEHERDTVVSGEIDRLAKLGIPTRAAFLSEMLCLRFPKFYPVLNKPIRAYKSAISLRMPRNAIEGQRYVFLAHHLRRALADAPPNYPAKNLSELDGVIWLANAKQD